MKQAISLLVLVSVLTGIVDAAEIRVGNIGYSNIQTEVGPDGTLVVMTVTNYGGKAVSLKPPTLLWKPASGKVQHIKIIENKSSFVPDPLPPGETKHLVILKWRGTSNLKTMVLYSDGKKKRGYKY